MPPTPIKPTKPTVAAKPTATTATKPTTTTTTAKKPAIEIAPAILAMQATDLAAMRAALAQHKVPVEQFGSTFTKIQAQSAPHAATFAAAYARELQTVEEASHFFGTVATADPATRKAIVVANRDNHNGMGVVHSIGTLPAAQARVLMQDFLVQGNGVHPTAIFDVASWFALAGQTLLAQNVTLPGPNAAHDGLFDDIGNFFKGAVSTVVHAVSTVADAVGNAVGDFVKGVGHIASAVVGWTAAQIKNLVHGILSAGKTIGNVIEGAFSAGLQALQKMVQGIISLGHSLADILTSIANFSLDAISDTLRALKNLGQQIVNVVGWMVGKAFNVVKNFVEAMIHIGEQIGDVLAAAVRFGAALVEDTVKALLAVGQAIGTILVTAVTHPGNFLTAVVQAFQKLGHNAMALLTNVRSQGLN
ncbi:MAG: hypothetical protein WBQ00_19240, partial [Terriglobales bacterium]